MSNRLADTFFDLLPEEIIHIIIYYIDLNYIILKHGYHEYFIWTNYVIIKDLLYKYNNKEIVYKELISINFPLLYEDLALISKNRKWEDILERLILLVEAFSIKETRKIDLSELIQLYNGFTPDEMLAELKIATNITNIYNDIDVNLYPDVNWANLYKFIFYIYDQSMFLYINKIPFIILKKLLTLDSEMEHFNENVIYDFVKHNKLLDLELIENITLIFSEKWLVYLLKKCINLSDYKFFILVLHIVHAFNGSDYINNLLEKLNNEITIGKNKLKLLEVHLREHKSNLADIIRKNFNMMS